MLLSQGAGSVSSGNLSAFDVIGSKVCKIAGNDIATMIVNEESFLLQHCNFKSKTLSPKL